MREFLKGLDLDKELIDTIMAEHGKQLTGLKEQVEEYKTKVSNYETQINDLNGKIEESNKSLENLQTITNENKDLKNQIQMNGSNVKKEFMKFVTSEVSSKVNDDTDFATALESYKKENPQFFGDTQIKKVQSSPNLNGGSKETTTNDIMNNLLRGNKD
ncbi:MAG: hypothetical protein IJ690_01825 [Clostridia bacterium]|nr:hypothetical protein [Clostridia bacterium]